MSITKQFTQLLPLAAIVAGLLSYNFMSAQWIVPTAKAPGNNTEAPINVGVSISTVQNGIGTLVFNRFAAVDAVWSDKYCDALGTNCWNPTSPLPGSSAGIISLSQGIGITLTPNPITSAGSIAANLTQVQSRVTGTCPAGQAIRVVNVDGTVACQLMTAVATVYSCPVRLSNFSNNPPCHGQLQLGSTCSYYTMSPNNNTQLNQVANCTAVGHLAP